MCNFIVEAILTTVTRRNIKLPFNEWPSAILDHHDESDVFQDPDHFAQKLAGMYGLDVKIKCTSTGSSIRFAQDK